MAVEEYQEAEDRFAFLTTQRRICSTRFAIRCLPLKKSILCVAGNSRRPLRRSTPGSRNRSSAFRRRPRRTRLLEGAEETEAGVEIVRATAWEETSKRAAPVRRRALTALALLISLFRYKPSPFCVLDEVDAPLDDANVDRFAQVVRNMSTQTQFIVITHSKRTMETASALYGVTMEEPGISKIVSVRLN